MAKVAFFTLGCKLNFSETSTIGSQFLKRGYTIVDFKEPADIYVINTCSVTDGADKECRQIVRRALRTNPSAFIIVTGCYAQLRPDEIVKIEGVDAVLGSNEKFKLFSLLENFEKSGHSCVHVSSSEELEEIFAAYSGEADCRTRAFLKIQDGCDYKCSYCTIPMARGKSRSLEMKTVKDNIIKMLQAGYKEIVLTGVNVGDYGKALEQDFISLVKELISIEGDFRLRISSIEPNLISDELIELTATNDKLCKHFHVPLQSGSDKILRLMQRRYTTADYAKLLSKIKAAIPKAGIGADVIVGFPGENQDDFQSAYDFIKELPVSYLHVFTYSERPNTKALNMDGNVPIPERKRRNNMLRILGAQKKHEFYSSLIDQELNVLFEHENHEGLMLGFAGNYTRFAAPFDEKFVNAFTRVRVSQTDGIICKGQII